MLPVSNPVNGLLRRYDGFTKGGLPVGEYGFEAVNRRRSDMGEGGASAKAGNRRASTKPDGHRRGNQASDSTSDLDRRANRHGAAR